jgi:hypothetical protein
VIQPVTRYIPVPTVSAETVNGTTAWAGPPADHQNLKSREGNSTAAATFLSANGVGSTPRGQGDVIMHKAELDRLLEKTVADALGVRMPTHRRAAPDKAKHHAKAPRRHKPMVRELHPA